MGVDGSLLREFVIAKLSSPTDNLCNRHVLRSLWCSGRRSWQGLVFSEKNMARKKLCLSGRRSLRWLLSKEKHVQKKNNVSRVAVLSRGSCFPRRKKKHAQEMRSVSDRRS